MIEGFSSRSGIRVDFVQNTDIGRLPLDVETALYRVVQEGLTNIHRHAQSDSAHIELTREMDKIVLIVKDEGCGLPEAAFDPAGDGVQALGVGIRGMRERLRLLGGWLDISSNESGTTLTGIVPIAAE
jgi:signal transduction histidine kinase